MTYFAGTRTLLRFALRRDRIMLPSWMAVYLAYTVGGTAAALALYPDLASRTSAAAAVNNMPALVVMYGRVWDPSSAGAVAMMKPIGFGGIFAAIFGILLMTRHTRSEEESGRLELVAAQPVGRWAQLASACLLVFGVMSALAVVEGVGLTASGLAASSSWAFACSTSLAGLTFAGLAAITAQLTQSARTGNVIAFAALTLSFILRGTADIGVGSHAAWWSWISPIGWQDQVRAFAGDRWIVLLPLVLASMGTVAVGLRIARTRDLDAGVIPQRAGRSSAKAWLSSPIGLAIRLQRGLFLGIFTYYFFMSLLLGAIVSSISDFLDAESMRKFLEAVAGTDDPFKAFMAFEIGFTAVITAVCGVMLSRRIATEEQEGRLEPVLATAVSHTRAFSAYVATAALATTLLQTTIGVGFWLGNGLQTSSYSGLWDALVTSLVWIFVALTFLLIAVRPTLTFIAWLLLVAVVIIDEFGSMFSWPDPLLNASPFRQTPLFPMTAMHWTPELCMLAVTAALLGFAYRRFQARDLATP